MKQRYGHRHGQLYPGGPENDPAVVAKLALDGLFAGGPEVLADNLSRTAKAQLSGA
jgi:hypothetical protein